MCLATVDEKPTVTEGEGWKVFSHSRDGHLTQWMSIESRPQQAKRYPCGYHLFPTERGAIAWADSSPRRKVSFRGVVATGTQSRYRGKPLRTIVAREIYIHPKGM